MEIKGKTAIITGGASGLGEATTRLFASLGANVAIFDLNEERMTKLTEELGGNALPVKVNVAEEEEVKNAVAQVVEKFGALHIACHYAGIGAASKIYGKNGPHPYAIFQHVLNVNLFGTFNIARFAAEAMDKNEPFSDDGQRGVIINTASVAAYEGQMGQTAYSASKGGVVGMTLPMARDLAQSGIRVNTIVPGLIHTPLMAGAPENVYEALKAMVPNPRRLGKADEIARTAQYIVECDYVNGECIRVDGAIRMQPR